MQKLRKPQGSVFVCISVCLLTLRYMRMFVCISFDLSPTLIFNSEFTGLFVAHKELRQLTQIDSCKYEIS